MKTSIPGHHAESKVVVYTCATELPKVQALEVPASVLQLRGDEYLLTTCGLLRRNLPARYQIQQALCAVGGLQCSPAKILSHT